MSTTSTAAAAAASARQRLASVLGTLQQDPNLPPTILEIVSGLARAIGPLFQLERGSADMQLFVAARGVLQETLAALQGVDQNYPGVGDATGAIADALRTIFGALREAGLAPPAGGAAPPSEPARSGDVAHGATQLAPPAGQQAAFAATQLQQPPASAEPQNPFAAPQPKPAAISLGQPKVAPPPSKPSSSQQAATRPAAPHSVNAAVPNGPNGLPRLESEVGVHSETNFYTDFLGDIRNHGGIFVATFQTLAIGTPCEVIVTFPGNLTAEIRGTVRWQRSGGITLEATGASPGLGVEITQANGEAWNLIERFIRKREPIMHEM